MATAPRRRVYLSPKGVIAVKRRLTPEDAKRFDELVKAGEIVVVAPGKGDQVSSGDTI